MSKLRWYWHRLQAMSPSEMGSHVRKKLRQAADGRGLPDWTPVRLERSGVFPGLPKSAEAPGVLRDALRRDADLILKGHWKAFGHLDLRVDDPPKWHCDYLAGRELATRESAFQLNHRDLPAGTDVKLIWELSRWHALVRLAMAAFVLGDGHAGAKCVEWLEDWVKHNPPYRGWNWTSALESGMRLVQFTWIDALLRGGPAAAENAELNARLTALAREVLPAHAWFTWRYRSFGSSANNHLIGELAGLIVASARWPGLVKWCGTLDELQERWEHEVIAQFAEDGGNREQALNYHLFSWEFCWQAREALVGAGRKVSTEVERRLVQAARFYWEVQVRREPWDYGDSDSALVTPFLVGAQPFCEEWSRWFERATPAGALDYWLGSPPEFRPPLGRGAPAHATSVGGWWLYQETGIAFADLGSWWLRWDVSPLGYLKTAAHGHLDELHLSIWRNGVALVIDPGTGAYYGNRDLRSWLASRSAHNGPCPGGEEIPRRLGPFLWDRLPDRPTCHAESADSLAAEFRVSRHRMRRRVSRVGAGDGWTVEDQLIQPSGEMAPVEFTVRWQFAPGTRLKRHGERRFQICRDAESIGIEVGDEWSEVLLIEENDHDTRRRVAANALEAEHAGTVSSAFRKTEWAPFLKLMARPKPGGTCVFRTTFLASPRS